MTIKDLEEAQRALEDESRALGIARYRQQRSKWTEVLGAGIDEAALPPGRRLLRYALQPTIAAIAAFMAAANAGRAGRKHSAITLLAGAQAEPLAYLTLRSAIQSGVRNERLQRASIAAANAVIGHLEAEQLSMTNPKGAAGLQRSLASKGRISSRRAKLTKEIYRAEGVALDWSQRDKLLVGSKLIELAAEATGLFDIVLVETGRGKQRRKEYQLQLTGAAEDWLEKQHARCELLDPIPLPMVVPPRRWTNSRDGGYLSLPIGNQLVRGHPEPYLMELDAAYMPRVFRAVNMIQGTPWRINRRVLEVMRTAWESGDRLGGLPPRDNEPIPNRPRNEFGEEAVTDEWRRLAAEQHAANARLRSVRMSFLQRLWVAEKLAGYEAIYFPHNLDFRGRIYPIPAGGPHPQDADFGRAMLTFSEGIALGRTGARWLAIHLANLFGIDKVSFDERVAWVTSNEAAILDSATDPLDGARFWATADKPWQALAACFEWAGYKAEGESFRSHLPVALDGSNSGLQHFTALLRDPQAACHVNLQDQEAPGDLYKRIAEIAQRAVDGSSDVESLPWKGGKVTRKAVKRPCMTYAYAVSRRGMAQQLLERLASVEQMDDREKWASAFWLAGVLEGILADEVPAARRAMDWLKKVMRLVNSTDLPIWWDTPAGLPVMQRYPKMSGRSIEVTFEGRRLQLQLQETSTETDPISGMPRISSDGREALSGIAPNFIHSMDAAHLMLVANACGDAGIEALAVIHDSFGTHAGRTEDLAEILRNTFMDMYQTDPLRQFRDAVMEQLATEPGVAAKVPPLPSYGDFDLQQVRSATYMFA